MNSRVIRGSMRCTFGSLVQTNIASTIDFETNIGIGFRPFRFTTEPARANGVISSAISGIGFGVGFAHV